MGDYLSFPYKSWIIAGDLSARPAKAALARSDYGQARLNEPSDRIKRRPQGVCRQHAKRLRG